MKNAILLYIHVYVPYLYIQMNGHKAFNGWGGGAIKLELIVCHISIVENDENDSLV